MDIRRRGCETALRSPLFQDHRRGRTWALRVLRVIYSQNFFETGPPERGRVDERRSGARALAGGTLMRNLCLNYS